ncbi:MAG: cell division protein ZapA [Prevotella sp.]|nr:cell division protein ZapA [Prevotella sp.]
MPDEKLKIKLHMYNTELSVNVSRDEEALYRRAGKLVDQKVNSYANFWRDRKTESEILFMALLDIAFMFEKESTHNDTAPYSDILSRLTSEIEEALKD